VIHNAIRGERGMKVYIISPMSISEIEKYISQQDFELQGRTKSYFTRDVMKSLGGYFTENITDIFFKSETVQPSQIQKEIEECFWGDK
jgi:hypothetical protein